eukprot:CAMPEP_0174368056 /NCGR_PEP_ID=MMETSP0811_2-20130205/87636_1 /TAXON_ID=73025 ORGANISM="Eutreptiella gymnastica-like, Strain CCMP1594" /NCGR_SAMPLE_ID=MMETSP0811_2 /ASSEMBLY_ACC=CAM_ASM_000667 /LENGTH=58 /DNA_ID=CAMNT_0015511213 /DNA_START=269 /DNA_END=445 /DNA_ORIENTATION=+
MPPERGTPHRMGYTERLEAGGLEAASGDWAGGLEAESGERLDEELRSGMIQFVLMNLA